MNHFWKAVFILAMIGVVAETTLVSLIFYTEKIDRVLEERDAIIVLGARVMPDGELSTTLLHRVQTALKVYQDGYAPVIIVCGARGADEPETEAGAMAKWLKDQGAPESAVIVEDQSTDTIENFQNARAIMEEKGMETAIVVTSDYHLTRALWIAEDQGLDAIGAAAPGNLQWHKRMASRFRESLSWVNYFMGGFLKNFVFWR